MSAFKEEFYKDVDGEHRWRLVSANGQNVASSNQGFGSKASAQKNLNLVLYGAERYEPEMEPPRAIRDPEGVLAGDLLLPREVAALLYGVKFTDVDKLIDMTATTFGESAGYTEAVGPVNSNGTQDFGLFQLNSGHVGSMTMAEFTAMAFDPVRAVVFARKLYVNAGYSLRPWYAYTNGTYKRHLPKAITGVANMIAEQRALTPVPLVKYA